MLVIRNQFQYEASSYGVAIDRLSDLVSCYWQNTNNKNKSTP